MSDLSLRVQKKMCWSCIYKPHNRDNLKALEDQVRDPHMSGFFTGYRVCHHTPSALSICCFGFWKRYKGQFTLGQLAQRLGLVEKVQVDTFE